MSWQPISAAPNNTRVLVSNGSRVFIARFGTIRWYDDSDKLIEMPTMWMPLPELPKEPRRTNN